MQNNAIAPTQEAAGPKYSGPPDPLTDRSRFAGAEYAINRALHGPEGRDALQAAQIAVRFWDVSVNDVFFDRTLSGNDAFLNYYYETGAAAITFGPDSMRSARWLLSTAHHEGVTHLGQFQSGNRGALGTTGYHVNELEALDMEIEMARRLGLSQSEIGILNSYRDHVYQSVVGTPYQSRVDRGNYQLF